MDSHEVAIQNAQERNFELNDELQDAKGSTKRRIKKEIKQNQKTIKKQTKAHDKHVKYETKQDEKTERVGIRQSTKAVAYQNGIDPLGNALQGVAGVVGATGSAIGAGMFGRANVIKANKDGEIIPPEDSNNKNMLFVIVMAVIALFGMSSKRR